MLTILTLSFGCFVICFMVCHIVGYIFRYICLCQSVFAFWLELISKVVIRILCKHILNIASSKMIRPNYKDFLCNPTRNTHMFISLLIISWTKDLFHMTKSTEPKTCQKNHIDSINELYHYIKNSNKDVDKCVWKLILNYNYENKHE